MYSKIPAGTNFSIISISSKIINDSGCLYLVHRCDRFVEILDLFKKYRFGLRKLQFVYDNYNSNSFIFKAA